MILLFESILFWPIFVTFVMLCGTTFLIERSAYGWVGFWQVVFIAAACWFFREPLLAMWNEGHLVQLITKGLAWWVVAGLVTAFAMWLYIIRRAARFISDQAPPSDDEAVSFFSTNLTKYPAFAITEHSKQLIKLLNAANKYCARFEIKGNYGLTFYRDDCLNQANLERAMQIRIETYLPPRAGQNKMTIIAAALVWPSTLLWLALYGVLNEIAHYSFKVFKTFLDWTSQLLFPSMGLKPLTDTTRPGFDKDGFDN